MTIIVTRINKVYGKYSSTIHIRVCVRRKCNNGHVHIHSREISKRVRVYQATVIIIISNIMVFFFFRRFLYAFTTRGIIIIIINLQPGMSIHTYIYIMCGIPATRLKFDVIKHDLNGAGGGGEIIRITIPDLANII